MKECYKCHKAINAYTATALALALDEFMDANADLEPHPVMVHMDNASPEVWLEAETPVMCGACIEEIIDWMLRKAGY